MFDFDAGKLLIVGVIALIFIPPKDLPRVLRQAGQFVGKMRRMASEFQGQFMDAMREADMADIRREAQKLAETVRIDAGFDSVQDLTRKTSAEIEANALERPASAQATSAEPPAHDASTALSDAPVAAPSLAPASDDPAAEAERLTAEARHVEAEDAPPPVRHSA